MRWRSSAPPAATARTPPHDWTFAMLDAESDRLARGLAAIGTGRGTRTVLMVPPSLDFFALTFALFKAGAVPVLIDPGHGSQEPRPLLAEAATGGVHRHRQGPARTLTAGLG